MSSKGIKLSNNFESFSNFKFVIEMSWYLIDNEHAHKIEHVREYAQL